MRVIHTPFYYSQVANRRGGRLSIFRNFSDLPGAYYYPPLLIFKKEKSDQDVFQFFLSKKAYLTPI